MRPTKALQRSAALGPGSRLGHDIALCFLMCKAAGSAAALSPGSQQGRNNALCLQVYDIFRSSKAWTPKTPGMPLARVCLAGPELPSIFQMMQAELASPGVPVKWAICRNGTAAFHGFEPA